MEQTKKTNVLEKILGSRITTETIGWKEKYLGHLVGPLGLILVINTIAALIEKFFTQQASLFYASNPEMLAQMGDVYEVFMTVGKIGATIFGLVVGFILEKIPAKYGRFRPIYYLIGWISILIGFLIFLFPGTTLGDGYWVFFFGLYGVYTMIGSTYFYLFRDNIVSLSTHNKKQKAQLTFIRKLSWVLISGILIGLLVSTVIIPLWLEYDINGYGLLMVILSALAIPLFLMEYYYTKERIIDDENKEGKKDANKIPVLKQFRALLTNKYFVLLFILTTLQLVVDNFKGGNVQYFYVKFLLGGDTNGAMFSLFSIITGVPQGIGAFAIYPLAKKFGVKNVSLVGFLLYFIGSTVCMIAPDNLPIALTFGFVRQLGQLPYAYIFFTLVLYGFDSVEFKSGFRAEGLIAAAFFTALATAISAPFAGGYESSLLKMGFIDEVGVTPNAEIKEFMAFAFYGLDIILSVAYLIILPFVDIEKKMDFINAELLRRRKQECLDKGLTWVDPEEQERLELIQQETEYEANRIKDLKAKCEKKGLNFEEENNKYLEKKAAKEAKLKEKEEAKKAKQEAKEAKKKEKKSQK